tara:strand:+ start:628 stop:873 length:246 start_codon:yes stop_codon:yes gene_type:complete
MNIKILLAIAFFLFICFIYIKARKANKIKRSYPSTMFDWMKMNGESRYLSDLKYRTRSMERKKTLLVKIREEYKNIAKKST